MALQFTLFIVLAYLVGSIPTSVWVGKLFFRLDIRQHGSGNAGATNTIRVLGWKAGLPVFIFDVFKGWLAVMLADFFIRGQIGEEQLVFLKIALAAAVVIGHVFPMFAGFRGGKGVATLLGVGIALYPLTVWIVLAVFIVILLITGYVSLGSVSSSILFPVLDYFLVGQENVWLIGLSVLVAIFIPVTHRKNIRRLLKGEESKFRPKLHGNRPGPRV
ncbi:MAG: glycerol-3-phosphate 1-O-acyltransferase PlsY [Bacteroidales bacterium]|jgi:glycerol-3-phosphate acyltransferase PlsY|nr:glycerol-3-phosphate 1-O-acyltransferase PlsY [Bacteroidales bacterium]